MMPVMTLNGQSEGTSARSPLERAKAIAAGMARSEKDAHWLGVRMENLLRGRGERVGSVTSSAVCDYLEQLMRRGLPDWQVKQSLEAIGLLLWYGYNREDLGVPALREAWGVRLNERVGVCVAASAPGQTGGPPLEVITRLRRVLRVADYALKTKKTGQALCLAADNKVPVVSFCGEISIWKNPKSAP